MNLRGHTSAALIALGAALELTGVKLRELAERLARRVMGKG